MKTIFRFLNGAAMTVAILAVGAMAGFAQDACADVDGQNALYTKFTANYNKKTVVDMESALAAGKELLEKYGACESLKEQIDFVKPHVARLETAIPAAKIRDRLAPIFVRYDAGIKGNNAAEIISAGKEILTVQQKEDLNIIVPMALSAAYQSNKDNNFKYSEDGLRYSTLALGKLKGGAELSKKDEKGVPVVGVLDHTYTKDAAITELTYAVGFLNYYAKKDKKAALPYYYELTQNGRYKDEPSIYATLGNYYVDEATPIIDEIAKVVQQLTAATDETVKADLEKQVKAKIGMFNGYAERAMDALGRAYSKANKPAQKALKDSVYKQIQALYERRFEKKEGLDSYIASTVAKPMPNPTTPVTPVIDPEPTTTTTTTSTAAPATAKPASATTTTPTKPMSTIPTKTSVAKKGTRR